ncbi:archaeal proteasome endopeptidase complex subunit alpha [Candidatus Woesearchaeota archaeon]|nr:archaeal proteasome endopeptidase complex subunit alpha [Candidatus Woesearchaeota archaeon]
MQQMSNQMMGYDRTQSMFSPDGRLLQIEYAKKTVRQGTTALGMVCKDGVILISDKRIISKLVVSKSIEKLFQIDEHIGAAVSGLVSDGRILFERAQIKAQQHKVTYDEPIDIQSLVKDICNVKQAYSQYGGARPFGVSLLFAGIDEDGAKLFATEPSGIFFQYNAAAIGEGETEIMDALEKEYKDNLTMEQGFALAISIFKKVLQKEFDINRFCASYIALKDKKYVAIGPKELKKYA